MFSDVDSDSDDDDDDDDDLSGEGEDEKPKAGRPAGPIAPRFVNTPMLLSAKDTKALKCCFSQTGRWQHAGRG